MAPVTRMNFEYMLSEKNQMQKKTYFIISLLWSSGIGKINV